MSVDSSQMGSHQNFSTFLETHKGIAIGGGVVLLLIVVGIAMRSKQKTLPATSTADLSGLDQGKIYVPTQTSFSTQNVKYGPQINSNDPLLTTVSGTQTVTGPTTTTTTTKTTNPPPVVVVPPVVNPPPRVNPPPVPVPITNKGLIWDTRRVVLGGETLSSIAAGQTRYLRTKGMPGSMSITWNDLWAHNQGVITQYAQQHGYRTDYWNWIFPGETIIVPRWG